MTKKNRPACDRAAMSADPAKVLGSPAIVAALENLAPVGAEVSTTPTGMLRLVIARGSDGACLTCRQVFAHLGGAVSHSRSTGHVVTARYRVEYVYARPGEVAL